MRASARLLLIGLVLLAACLAPTPPAVSPTAPGAVTASLAPTRPAPATSPTVVPTAPPALPTTVPVSPTLALSLLAEWEAPYAHTLAWFADGTRLAVSSTTGVYVYDAATLQEVDFVPSAGPVGVLAISHNARTLAAYAWPDGLRFFDLRTGQRQAALEAAFDVQGETSAISSLAFSPDDRYLAIGQNGGVVLWDLVDGRLLHTWPQETYIDAGGANTVAFSRDGRLLATDSPHGVSVWDVQSGIQVHALTDDRGGQPSRLAFSHDDRVLIAAGASHLTFWDVASGALRRERAIGAHAGLALARDGLRLASVGDGYIALSDSVSGQPHLRLMTHSGYAPHLAFSPNGTRLAALDANGKLFVWQTDIGRVTASLDRHHFGLTPPALSPDGQTLAFGSGHRVWVWNFAAGQPPRPLFSQPDLVTSLAFSPDGRWLVTGGAAPTARRVANGPTAAARVWDLAAGRLYDTLPSQGYVVAALAFSPDGLTLATGGEDTVVRLWDVSSGQLRRELTGYQTSPARLVFSPDGLKLISLAAPTEGCYEACHPGMLHWREEPQPLRLWDTTTGVAQMLELPRPACGVEEFLFDPGGRLLFASPCGRAELSILVTGRPRQTVTLPEPLTSLALSPDGRTLAAIARDSGDLILLDPATGARIARATLPHGPATWLAYLPNGRLLALGHDRHTLRLYQTRLTNAYR